MIHLHSLALPATLAPHYARRSAGGASVRVICLANHASVNGVIRVIELALKDE
jgi:hypothetical protein